MALATTVTRLLHGQMMAIPHSFSSLFPSHNLITVKLELSNRRNVLPVFFLRRSCPGCGGQLAEENEGRNASATERESFISGRSKEDGGSPAPILRGERGGREVDVVRDTGYEGVVTRKGLVEESQLTGESGLLIRIDNTAFLAEKAVANLSTPTYVLK
ncbi:transposon ty3-i Gag-Pol polyprotein-like protein [Plakobranchus ocellatus]|uniref:Transposon ty3-i Gag-Pol polyprotein-like protein n=1 Tax=Plakobranchus ocellatus TaxID=259542 RepID=A0AAV4B650_9GAST|nr:transposon ty3-i Gag-Pol polyprotein-like protein [Plakobranchus ocellatus]